MIALCLCNNMTRSLTEALHKKISWPNGANRPALRAGSPPPPSHPLAYLFWNFHWFLSIPEAIWSSWLELRVVSTEEGDFYFYTKSIPALSKLWFQRLPAMCWTWLKISGNPVCRNVSYINILLDNGIQLFSAQACPSHPTLVAYTKKSHCW